ncbi:MAG: hypothetical protein FD129_564, partial [bacterium]
MFRRDTRNRGLSAALIVALLVQSSPGLL